MTIGEWFSATYDEARAKFRDAAKTTGAELQSYNHSLKGPDGAELAMDLAYIVPTETGRVEELSSATHGVEGFCGSGYLLWRGRAMVRRCLGTQPRNR